MNRSHLLAAALAAGFALATNATAALAQTDMLGAESPYAPSGRITTSEPAAAPVESENPPVVDHPNYYDNGGKQTPAAQPAPAAGYLNQPSGPYQPSIPAPVANSAPAPVAQTPAPVAAPAYSHRAAAPAPAQSQGIYTQPSGLNEQEVSFPEENAGDLIIHGSGPVKYISGGIGTSEREALDKVANQFNLKLLFALSTGNYLSDIQVTVRDQAGNNVISAPSEGPFFYAALPASTYTVEASVGGETKSQKVTLTNASQKTANFIWHTGSDPSAPNN